MLTRTLGEHVDFQIHLAAQPLRIQADASMLDQVILNLVVNARDAMPGGGRLVVTTSEVEFDDLAAAHSERARPGSFACLSVSDTGQGIPPAILPRIFEPFFTTKGAGQGSGLGLATVFGIVEEHQGWINVYSEVDHGTTIRIYFPRLPGMGGPNRVPPEPVALRRGGETILLTEDEFVDAGWNDGT